ncbi:uncharacterized protein YlxW (UPF0749 family) [Peribacillus deserti]|uniref:Uncharacterized protein YlxW (UPF0749 family) n=1 Tax=Peribacillus deserti TaxID=673318 RepID=A0ABS2QGR7_9BACI|nr:DUF881 domain-containing protein [Peribacillus deserti]MBM7692357.1 uncharacterized protein YlxW (UPF0749 family) [Peribacillus deserti]
MKKDIKWGFTGISIIVGLMLAIQFQTVKQPKIKDTRDGWELRTQILAEQQMQSKLLTEIRELEEQASSYETKRSHNKESALKQTLNELKQEAGQTKVTGEGIVIKIKPLPEAELLGETIHSISPELLERLLNEINMYNAEHISINGQRVINTTVIREINGEPKIGGFSLGSYPITVRVLSSNAQNLHDRIKVSKVIEQFFIDNLSVEISDPVKELAVPSYQNPLKIKYLEPAGQE